MLATTLPATPKLCRPPVFLENSGEIARQNGQNQFFRHAGRHLARIRMGSEGALYSFSSSFEWGIKCSGRVETVRPRPAFRFFGFWSVTRLEKIYEFFHYFFKNPTFWDLSIGAVFRKFLGFRKVILVRWCEGRGLLGGGRGFDSRRVQWFFSGSDVGGNDGEIILKNSKHYLEINKKKFTQIGRKCSELWFFKFLTFAKQKGPPYGFAIFRFCNTNNFFLGKYKNEL